MSATMYSTELLARLRRSLAVAGVLVFAFGAAACGDDDDDDGGTGPSADCIDELNWASIGADEDDVEAIGVDDSDSGSLSTSDPDDVGFYFDAYALAGEDVDVTVELNPSDFDGVILLFDEDFELINGADNGGVDDTEAFEQTLDEGACYAVVVTSFDEEETGSYTLSVEEN